MKTIRVVVEFLQDGTPAMRWERTSPSDPASAYELLGRAFEVAQREEATSFAPAMTAFLKGALIRRKDLQDLLPDLD